ncbi:MAG TPA: GAF domain-containing protein [Acidimicrobiia bacterium]
MPGQVPIERVRSLADATASLVGSADLETLLRRIVQSACEATDARYGALGVIGPHKTLVEFVHRGIDVDTATEIGHLPAGKGVLGTLIRDRQTIVLANLADHPDSVGFPANHPPMESFLGVPVGGPDNAFGNLYLTEKAGGFNSDDVVVVEALAAVAAAAVETVGLRRRLENLAIVEDRLRIGRDLHDSIIQDLFGTGLHLQGLATATGDDLIRDGLNEASDRIDETIEALRRIVSNLGSESTESNFADLLREHLDHLSGPYRASVRISVTPAGLKLDKGVVDSIHPIIVEAVSNSLRHSESDSVDVKVEMLGDRLLITVADQGVGFSVDGAQRGMGLNNLEERAAALEGDSTIRSVVGVGTVVEVAIPIVNDEFASGG